MTNDEAIEILKEEHDYAQLLPYVNETLKIAIKAIKKQIPKKPLFYDTKFRQRGKMYGELVTIEKAYNCPNCNSTVWGTDKHKFCDNCGQALDWSDVYAG